MGSRVEERVQGMPHLLCEVEQEELSEFAAVSADEGALKRAEESGPGASQLPCSTPSLQMLKCELHERIHRVC